MRARFASAWTGLIVTLAAGVLTSRGSAEDSAPATPDLPAVEKRIIQETNAFRKEQGRRELTVNAQLSASARYFADYLAQTGKFSHTADGKDPGERATQHGYPYCVIAENIAYEFDSEGFTTRRLADSMEQGWEHSPEHRRNMLDPDVTEIGVAMAYSAETGRYYGVQEFGKPKADAIHFRITNRSDATVDYTVDDRSFQLKPRYEMVHETCRPPTLTVQLPAGKSGASPSSQVYHPENGSRYMIRRGESGSLHITSGTQH